MMAKPFPVEPYMGLRPYLEENARFFFGRGRVQDNIIANLKAKRLTLVFGPSGVGKSSVLNAGVAHNLRRVARKNLGETGKPELAVAVFQDWENNPVAGLTTCVQEAVRKALEEESSEPMPESTSLVDASQLWTERVGGDIFIILDQFEKYFLYHPYEDGKSGFAYELARMVKRPDLRVNFLISVRDDALSKIERFQENILDIFDNLFEIEHLDSAAARSAIEEPVHTYNRFYAVGRKRISIEPELVEAVLSQVRTGRLSLEEDGGGLTKKESDRETEASIETPFLQLVMTELWEKEINSGSAVLRLTTLNSMGGAEKIVQTHLARVMEKLPKDEQAIAARTFHYLVTPSGSKIALSASDLAESAGLDRNKLVQLLEGLSSESCRILRAVGASGAKSESRYEVFHDKLAEAILNWRRAYVKQRQARRRVLIFAILILSVLALSGAAIAWIQHQRAEAEEQVIKEKKKRFRLQVSNLSNRTIAQLYWSEVQAFDPEQLSNNPVISQLEKTLQGYQQDGNQAGEGITLNNIAGIHQLLGNTSTLLGRYEQAQKYYQRAEEYFQQARPLLENTLGPDHSEVATNLNDLAVIFAEQDKYKEAEPLFTQALSILENIVEPDDRYLADPLTNLAECYYSQGKYKEAEPLYNRALEIRKNKSPVNKSDVAKSLSDLGWLYLKQGNYNAAEQRFNESLEIWQDNQDQQLNFLNGLAELYRERREYDDADLYLAEVRRIHKEWFAANKKLIGLIGWKEQLNADDSDNLGKLYLDQHNYADAEQQFNAALVYWENPFRKNYPTRASILSSLAYVYYGQKRYDEAERLFKDALEIQQKALPYSPELARTLNGLAQLYADLGKYDDAEKLFKEAIEIQEKAAPKHPYLADILNNYAALLRKVNKEMDAQSLEERARQIMADHKRENPDN